MKRLILLSSALVLSGCAKFDVQAPLSASAPVFTGETSKLKEVLVHGYAACLPTNAAAARATPQCGTAEVENFIGAGLRLSDIYCDDFFRAANQSARKRQYGRGVVNDAGGAVQAVLGLAKVASGVVGGVGAGIAFADSTFRNYDTSFMVDADLSRLRRLVMSAQDRMQLDIQKVPTTSIYTAESRIRRYAGLCTFLGMKGLLDQSLAEKADAIEQANKADQRGGAVPVVPVPPVPAPAAIPPVPVAPLPPPG